MKEELDEFDALEELCEDLLISQQAEAENEKDWMYSQQWVNERRTIISRRLLLANILTRPRFNISWFRTTNLKSFEQYEQLGVDFGIHTSFEFNLLKEQLKENKDD